MGYSEIGPQFGPWTITNTKDLQFGTWKIIRIAISRKIDLLNNELESW